MKGAYLLIINVNKPTTIRVGKLGKIKFQGDYVYVGSAMTGLDKRIARHLKKSEEKKKFWHIDYLLASKNTRIIKVIKKPSLKKQECLIAREISKKAKEQIKGFGCSDCKCKSHLFKIKRNIE